jgi:PBP1b-binding outer membrane lipoprotein LpoB
MTMKRHIAVAALATVLAGCQSASYNPAPMAPPQPQGVEGQWVDPNGVVLSFTAGRYEARTTDTNSLLAQGSYTHMSEQLVQIESTSLLRNTTSRVNCALVSQTQLNCTSASGEQSTLVRRV